jgi:hypothetical protein
MTVVKTTHQLQCKRYGTLAIIGRRYTGGEASLVPLHMPPVILRSLELMISSLLLGFP